MIQNTTLHSYPLEQQKKSFHLGRHCYNQYTGNYSL